MSGAVAAETRVSNNHGNGSGGDSHSDSGHRKRQTSNQLAGTHYRRGRELLFCPLHSLHLPEKLVEASGGLAPRKGGKSGKTRTRKGGRGEGVVEGKGKKRRQNSRKKKKAVKNDAKKPKRLKAKRTTEKTARPKVAAETIEPPGISDDTAGGWASEFNFDPASLFDM